MAIKCYEHLGETSVDGLIATSYPLADTFYTTIRKLSEEAILKRGTLLNLSSGSGGDGNCVIHGTAAVDNETLMPFCVLASDTVVGTSTDIIAKAYRTGHFVKESLIVAEAASISDADKEALRDVGILLSCTIEV